MQIGTRSNTRNTKLDTDRDPQSESGRQENFKITRTNINAWGRVGGSQASGTAEAHTSRPWIHWSSAPPSSPFRPLPPHSASAGTHAPSPPGALSLPPLWTPTGASVAPRPSARCLPPDLLKPPLSPGSAGPTRSSCSADPLGNKVERIDQIRGKALKCVRVRAANPGACGLVPGAGFPKGPRSNQSRVH